MQQYEHIGFQFSAMARHVIMESVFVLAFCVFQIAAYPGFQNAIPNGGFVPDPCRNGARWRPVGHATAFSFGGPLNPFGMVSLH